MLDSTVLVVVGYCIVVVIFEFEFIKIYLNGKFTKFEKLKFTVCRIYVNVYALIKGHWQYKLSLSNLKELVKL